MSILGEEKHELPRLVIMESGDENERRVEEKGRREDISFLNQKVEEKSVGEGMLEDNISDAGEVDPDVMRKLMMKKFYKDFKEINKARPDLDSDLPKNLPEEDWDDYFDVFAHDGDSADAELLITWRKICAKKECPMSNENQSDRLVQAVDQVSLEANDEAKKGICRKAATDHSFVKKIEERSSRRDSSRFEMEGIEFRKKRASTQFSEYPRSHKPRYQSMNPALAPTFTPNPLMRSFSPDFSLAEEHHIGFPNENTSEKSKRVDPDQGLHCDTKPMIQEVASPVHNFTQGSDQFAGSINGFYNQPMPFFPYFGQQNFPMMPSMPFPSSNVGVFPASPSIPFSSLPSIQQFAPSLSMQQFPLSASMQPYFQTIQMVLPSTSNINQEQNITPHHSFVPNFHPASFHGFPMPGNGIQGNGHFHSFSFAMPMPQQNIEPTQENHSS